MKNKELVDRRFDQIDGKIKMLNLLLSRQTSAKEFKDELGSLQDLVNELRSMIDREANVLRRG